MKRVGLVVLVALLLAWGRTAAAGDGSVCGFPGGLCCLDPGPACEPGLVCDLSNPSACTGLVWLGGGNGGAAEVPCPGTCVQPTATPTSTATPTATNTPTSTPPPTPTPTSTPTQTPTPHNLEDGEQCTASPQCASALCNGGVCAKRNPAPAVSEHTAVLIGTALLLAGLWSVRRVTRHR